MDLLDKLYIISGRKKLPFRFSDNPLSTHSVEITENRVAKLVFRNLPGYRLYLDGLELVSVINPNRIKVDNSGEHYITPAKDEYLLYNNRKNNFKYVPGRYLVRLVNEDSKQVMYSTLKVNARFFSDNELASIKSDLENTVKGLSEYFLAIRNGFKSTDSSEFNYDDLKAIRLLCHRYEDFKTAIVSLIGKPRFDVKVDYHWTKQMTGPLDRKALKRMAMDQRGDSQIYGKQRQITYDTRDNRNLKREINDLAAKVDHLKLVAKALKEGQSDDIKKAYHDNSIKILNDYYSVLNVFLNQSWVQMIPNQDGQATSLISNGYLDHRYAFFNQLCRQLEHPMHLLQGVDKQYLYYFKRTDLLYEIWGYIKVLEALKELKFKPVSGWIFDDVESDFYGLSSGTTVTFKSGSNQKRQFILKVIYDDQINDKKASKTRPHHPLWHGNQHNRPDILIEIYDINHVFIKAIILDTKYRNIDDIWQKETESQLTAYKDSVFSPYPFKNHKYAALKTFYHNISEMSAVISVGIIHPLGSENVELRKMRSGVYAIAYTPENNGLKLLKQFLERSFDEFEKTMDDYELLINLHKSDR